MLTPLIAFYTMGQGSPQTTFVDVQTNKARNFAAPSSAIIKSAKGAKVNQGWQFDLVMGGSVNPTSPEPQMLEIHLMGEMNVIGVCVLQLQGRQDVPKIGVMNPEECVYFSRSGKVTKIKPSVRKDGITIQLPEKEDIENWCAVTRWRPANLAETYSPSSIWNAPVSTVFGKDRRMQAAPSLPSFMKYEFGKGRVASMPGPN